MDFSQSILVNELQKQNTSARYPACRTEMLHKKDPAMGSFLWKRYRSAEPGVLQNVASF